MVKLSIDIGFEANDVDIENLQTGLAYISQDIENFVIDKEKQIIHFELKKDSDASQLEVLLKEAILKFRPFSEDDSTVILHDFKSYEVANSENVFSALVERGDITEYNEGYFALSGKLLQNMKKIDEELLIFARSLSSSEVIFPITTQISNLNKHDFFKQTPQFANFISTLREDIENISNLSKGLSGDDEFKITEHVHDPKCMCRSAVCLNSYPRYENKKFREEQNIALTSVGKVFRNESKNVQSLERLHEFSMREIIFFGSAEYVDESLKKCVQWCVDFIKKFKLKSIIQSANDPFFAENFSTLQFYQRSQVSKYEVKLFNPASQNQVSCASLNNHGTHFSKAFNIKFENDEYIFTGCAGWGLERCIFMIYAQYGVEEEKWPVELREFFKL
tara:strand:+ start:13481 stop:14656 length:1176 start_codon:yes stop_codon:yes gene_type:complete